MEYSHDVHLPQYELQQNFNQRHNPNGFLHESMGSTDTRTRSWIQEQQHQVQQTQQQPNQATGIQMNQALFYPQQHQHQQPHQQQQQPHQQQQQHQSINQQSNHLPVSFSQQSNSSWFNQQTQQFQQHQQQTHQQILQQQQPQQLYQQHQSTLQWTQLDSFNLNRIIDQSIVNHDLLINSFQSQLINQQPQQQQIYQHQQQQHPQPHQHQQPLLYPNRQRHDLLYYKQLQEQESQQIYHQQQQNHQQNHQQPQHQQPQQPKPLPKKVLFKFILNLTKPEAEQYLVQIAQTPALSTRIRLVENERKNLTINLIETLHPTQVNQFQQPQPEEYVFVSIELIIVKSAEDRAKKTDETQKGDCLHVEEIEDEVEVIEVENKNVGDRARKVDEIHEDCARTEEIDGKVEDKQAKLTRPSILIFSSSKDKEQVNVEKIVVNENFEQNLEQNVKTNVETIYQTQNVEDTAPDSQTLQTFSDQDVELNDQSTTTTVSIELDETVDEVMKGDENLKIINPERPLSLSSPEALTIQNILPDSSSFLVCTEDMPISPFLDQIKIPLGHNDPVGSTFVEPSVPTNQIIDPSQVEPSGTETNCNDSDATEIDNETVNETSVSESNMKRTRTSTTSSTVSISVPKRKKIKVDSSKSPNLQSTTSSTPKLQTKRKSSPKENPQRSKKHYHQSHLDLSSIIQSSVRSTANKRLTRSSSASLVQKQKQQQQPKRIGTRVQQSSKSNKLKRK